MTTIKRADLEHEISHFKSLTIQIKALKDEQEKLRKALIKSYFEKHHAYTSKDGSLSATYSTTTRHLFDSANFKSEQPELYEKYSYDQDFHTFLVR